MFDTASMTVVARAQFPAGSKPWMLRVSPRGREVWVQTASGTNVALDAATLQRRQTMQLGRLPVQGAWSPDGRYHFTTQLDEDWVAVTDTSSFELVKRLEVGPTGGNVSFRPDGQFAYVTVTGADSLAVVDVQALEVVAHLSTGSKPMGLALFPSAAG